MRPREEIAAALEALFAADVVSCSDGGGLVRAARTPVVGRARVAQFITAVAPHFWTAVTLVDRGERPPSSHAATSAPAGRCVCLRRRFALR
jgi:hypothetical protein